MASALIAAALLVGATDCGVKEYVNCRNICDRKKECGPNSNYDVDNCASVCSDMANGSDDYKRRVNSTAECLNGLSCTDLKVLTCLQQYSLGLP
jgi:hypothetical protein